VSRRALRELGLTAYAGIVVRVLGPGTRLALISPTGEPLGDSTEELPRALQPLRERITRGELASEQNTVGSQPSEDGYLVWRALSGAQGGFGGWLAAYVSGDEQSAAIARGLIEELARCGGREWDLLIELEDLAHDLGERQEELNLLYALGASRPLDRDAGASIGALLELIPAHLPVDLAVYVPEAGRPVARTPPRGRPIPSLDLLITEIRGNLYRFVTCAKQPVASNSTSDPKRLFLLRDQAFKFLAQPVLGEGRVRGMLVLLRRIEGADFTPGDRSLVAVIAEQAFQVQRRTALMERTRRFSEQMARALVDALEAKDAYTRGHSERVQAIAVQIGRALKLDDAALEDLFWGSILHDVGKIGIPDVILTKPGRLSPDEYTFVRTHPERSYEILRNIEAMSEGALLAARLHHERIDGGGYPLGLRGQDIPILARIVSVADTYDAITSSRSYRAAQPHQAAMQVLDECRGTQLDAEAVRVFEELCRDDLRWIEPPAHGTRS
jgi:HD-GYP domain-containing protein (c-di-GMP phosphodiesterase class II)